MKKFQFSLSVILILTVSFSGITFFQEFAFASSVIIEDGSVVGVNPKNIDNNKPVYFVNGVGNSFDNAITNARYLAENIGRPVILVYNESKGLVKDLGEATKELFSNSKSTSSEKLAELITNDLQNNESPEVFAHSQGGLKVEEALKSMQGSNPSFFEQNSNNINIETFGSPTSNFPDGPSIKQRSFALDPVAALNFQDDILWTLGNSIAFDGDHSFQGYVDSRHKFIIDDFRINLNLKFDEEGLAKQLHSENLDTVKKVFENLEFFNKDDVAHEFLKDLSVNEITGFDKDFIDILESSLEKGFTTKSEQTQIDKLKQALNQNSNLIPSSIIPNVPDDSDTTTPTSGTTVTQLPDGTQVISEPGGVTTIDPNGFTNHYESGTAVTQLPDGTQVISEPGGVTTIDPNGFTNHYESGTAVTQLPDGTTVITYPDGTTEILPPSDPDSDKKAGGKDPLVFGKWWYGENDGKNCKSNHPFDYDSDGFFEDFCYIIRTDKTDPNSGIFLVDIPYKILQEKFKVENIERVEFPSGWNMLAIRELTPINIFKTIPDICQTNNCYLWNDEIKKNWKIDDKELTPFHDSFNPVKIQMYPKGIKVPDATGTERYIYCQGETENGLEFVCLKPTYWMKGIPQ